MEKRKFDLNQYADMHTETGVRGKDGTEVVVRDHIPYKDKEVMARELLEQTVVIHDDSCIYTGSNYAKNKIYLVAKYYTDIDTDDMNPDDVADYMINNNIISAVMDYVTADLEYVIDMFGDLYSALDIVYADDNSLAKSVRKSFGSVLNGENITETLSKAEAVNDKTFEAFSLLRQSEKEKEKNIDNGTMTINGNIINLAKREK